jgi:hypothetical protein
VQLLCGHSLLLKFISFLFSNANFQFLREIDDLRRFLVSHFVEPRTDANQTQPSRPQPEVNRIQQTEMPLQHLSAACPPQLLPWLLNNGLSPSSPTTNTLKLLENLEAARNANQTPLGSFWSSLQNNTVVPTSSSSATNPVVSELSHAVAATLSNANIQSKC